MSNIKTAQRQTSVKWIPLPSSLFFLLRSPKLLGWSLVLTLATMALTWGGYLLAVEFVDSLTGGFFLTQPETGTIMGWVKLMGWEAMKWSFLVITRIIAFYLAFLVAYGISSPGYAFLSAATEKKQAGEQFKQDAAFTLQGILVDFWEGMKIACVGIFVTVAALLANFIPGVGQIVVFLLYTYYSALLFVDYPCSRKRWSLGKKMAWIRKHYRKSFRLGVMPALVSLIPVVNVFIIAMIFPLMTVHSTLNFLVIENSKRSKEETKFI